MRKRPHRKAEKHRIKTGLYKSPPNVNYGLFEIPTKKGLLRIIICDSDGWDHVSVSLQNRIPTWQEMCFVKYLFFDPEECVIQYHPPESKYINDTATVLHMWRPHNTEIPMPPIWMV